MNSPLSRRKSRAKRPLHPPLLGAVLLEMLFPAFDRACGHGPRDLGVGGEVPCLIEIFMSGWNHNYNRVHRSNLSETSDFGTAPLYAETMNPPWIPTPVS